MRIRGIAAFYRARLGPLPFRGGKCRYATSAPSDRRAGRGPVDAALGPLYAPGIMESAFSSTRAAVARRLRSAASEAEVVALVRDYLAEWRPEELAHVPQWCRPGKMRDVEDISDCAYSLTRHRMDGREANPLLVEMETFFAMACSRISALEGAAGRDRGRSDSESESA